ncbi:MAG: hypothetical protein DI534_10805 [Leifsonia xyli]|nr:MAG: hypothetical protein DI534_10805 [Leifsonia xyli]
MKRTNLMTSTALQTLSHAGQITLPVEPASNDPRPIRYISRRCETGSIPRQGELIRRSLKGRVRLI